MAQYAYLLCDMVTNIFLGYQPFTQVTFENVLNGPGRFEAYLPLADDAVQASDWDLMTIPARTALYVLRDDVPVWGGIIWTRDYDTESGKQALEHFQASTFESYYSHIPYVATTNWVGVDQFEIARELIASLATFGHVLPMPVSGGSSGVLQTYATLASDYKWVSDIFSDIQQLPNGFDWGVDVYYTPTTGPYKQLNLSYPRRGLNAENTPFVFEFPGNIWYYKWPEDGSAFATDVVELGAGSGPTMPVGVAGDLSLLAAGWPIMFALVSRKDITDVGALNAYAAGDLALYNQPSLLPELHVRADMYPTLGLYKTGDDVRFRACDPRFPGGIDLYLRIQSIKVTIADDGNEDVVLTCVPATS
jgi:hypothetical protein